jgi:hypothetical protein
MCQSRAPTIEPPEYSRPTPRNVVQRLEKEYTPALCDVICGRSKTYFEHGMLSILKVIPKAIFLCSAAYIHVPFQLETAIFDNL